MGNDKKEVQRLFDEVSERTGMPRVDLSEDDSAALPFGEDMLLHIHYRAEIPEVDFTVPLGSVPNRKKAAVYERLLSANFYWVGTQGATLSYQDNLDEVILQFREDTINLTAERLQRVLEGFLSVAISWKERLAKLIENADEEDESYEEDADLDFAAGQGDAGLVLFEG
ncbi:MAG: type III secretion system chaperone [Kiritimatiellae bacterium]|nr:type III secretion system chaperone [Kiritimatiellia bacterium]